MSKQSTILIVDDDHEMLFLLTKLLKIGGNTVIQADNGELALTMIEKERPDLVLLDMQMPKMNGLEVCRRAKANPEIADIPIIFLSAITEINQRIEGLQLGAIDFITKPFHNQELIIKVSRHLVAVEANKILKLQNEEFIALKEKCAAMEIEIQQLKDELSAAKAK